MTIKRYECITEWGGTNYDATPTEDGPWVSYDDHAKEIADLRALAREAEEKVKRLALALREIRTMVNSGSEEMHIIDEALHPNHAFGGWALNEENE
jgi:hypothetical protein